MSVRGRGTLTVKPSPNPFFQTVASDIGVEPAKNIAWKGNADPAMKRSNTTLQDNFSFLYTRESDKIGSMVNKPVMSGHKILSRTEFLKQRREKLRQEELTEDDISLLLLNQQEEIIKPDVPRILEVFKQGTKDEDPRYTTTNNEYGKKKPTIATFVADRASIPQGFSSSFNNVKPKNSGLNTGLSRSNVHSKLDPQFA
jgi:hypothetical protein